MPDVFTERLPNGLRTVLVRVPTANRVLLSLMVGVGARFDPPQRAGLSHFVEHLLFRGNARHPDTASVFAAFEAVGEVLGGETGVEFTEYDQVVHPERLPEALETLAAFARRPTFPDLEKERRIVLDEILYDYNEQGELIRLDAVTAELLWGTHPLAANVTGTRETVGRFDRDAVEEHYRRHYRPENMVLALAGRLEAAPTREVLARVFGDWRGAPGEPAAPSPGPVPAPGPRLRTVHDADNQVRLQLSFPVAGYRSPEEIPLVLLASVLDDGPNTRLQRIIREEQALVYYIACDYTAYADAGQIDITTAVSPDRLEALLESLFGILRDLREGGVTPGELAAARRRYRFGLDFSRDSLDAAIDRHAWPLLYSEVRSEEAEWAQVEAVDAGALSALGRQVFTASRAHLAAVGPLDDAARALLERYLESL